jgi:hypothetical protein
MHASLTLIFRSRAVPPMRDNDPIYRQSATSVYSQPSPPLPRDQPTEVKTTDGPEVSPMSTPRSSVNFAASDTSLISPVDSTFTLSARSPDPEQQAKKHNSRTSKLPQPAESTPSQRAKKQDTKWDDYSGEPTTAKTGKTSQAKPGTQQAGEMQYPQLKERTKQILAGLRERGAAQQKSTWGRAPPPVAAHPLDDPPPQKEPWKGGSGREAIVAPVKNTAAARAGPLKHPQRNVSKMDPVQDRARAMSPQGDPTTLRNSPEAVPGHVSQRTYSTQPKPKPELSIRVVPSTEEIKPVAPLKVKSPRVRSPIEAETMAPLQNAAFQNTSLQQAYLQSPFHSPHPSQTMTQNYASGALQAETDVAPKQTVEYPQHPQTAAGNESKRANETEQQLGASQMVHKHVSHLSWTTYATTTNDSPDSLRPTHMDSSPVPPLPMSAPLVMRKRPIASAPNSLPFSNSEAAGSRASLISRKPVPADRGRSVSGMSSASKSLPPTPVEMQAGDKIATLEARLEDLGMRRRNNRRIVRELQEGLRKNAIVYTTWKRTEVEKQIINLEQDLTDIVREEHEVGLHLHRAQKKRDREDCYENPTGLWIKRVTT